MIYSGKYKVTSPYGERVLSGAVEFHHGVDLVGITDKHVCSVSDGIVKTSTIIKDKSNLTWQWGNYVRIDGDDGYTYFYCHLAKRLVRAGERVKAGDHVGLEGNTGYSFGSHCHFEVRDNSGCVDPSALLGIANKIGIYGNDFRAAAAERFGLSEHTLKYLDKYEYAADLYRKLANEQKTKTL